ncbi:hypothetical protein GGX14DRAFT_519752 [Mycena pura]|uniref:Uncharacterized protein n=1 Tax=Mycena pura TaxID=153505 RepID=A0AAD6VI38_9AGAR|nr:hypothetical protein GGX14DRAFT_519752 [Mycena pura]
MTTTVPLSALATSLEDIDAPLTTKYLYPQNDCRLHRHMEYLWGLNIHTFNPAHERSIIRIRKSMDVPFLKSGAGSWTLAPTEETLAAMYALQKHNMVVPIYGRKSFLSEFPAAEYEYIFVPFTDVDFYVLLPGQAPRRLSAPYSDFPLVTSSANPFFVTFDSQLMIEPRDPQFSEAWDRFFGDITTLWGGALPEDFLLSSSGYPQTLISESGDGSEPDVPLIGPESKSNSDETILTPVDEEELASPAAPDKEAFVFDWVRRDATLRHERLIVLPLPPTPRGDRTRRVNTRDTPQWCTETQRGKKHGERLLTLSSG